jgi:hypothetical protein
MKKIQDLVTGAFLPWIVVLLVIIVAGVICVISVMKSEHYAKELAKRDQEFAATVSGEKVKIQEDLEEKYRADRISYEVMARQMARQANSQRALDAQEK